MRKASIKTSLIFCSFLLFTVLAVLAIFFLTNAISFSPPPEQETYLTCINNTCTRVAGLGVDECNNEGAFCGCIDTDLKPPYISGMNFFLQGTARNATFSKTDSCLVNGRLVEYVCEEDKLSQFEITCETLGNYTCTSGKCFPDHLELEDCKDDDGGLNYLLQGKASNGKVRITDYCTQEGKLAEIYCSMESEEILIQLYDCSTLGSFTCEDGSCVSTI